MLVAKDKVSKTLNEKGVLEGVEPKKLERCYYGDNNKSYVVRIFDCIGECGKEVRIQSKSKIKDHTGKCASCVQRGKPYQAIYNELYNRSHRHKKEVSMSYEEFYSFCLDDTCHYCRLKLNRKPYTKLNGKDVKGSRAYMLDRKDNSKGYSLDNVVNCCWTCNAAKGNRYEYYEWFSMTRFLREQNERRLNKLWEIADRE